MLLCQQSAPAMSAMASLTSALLLLVCLSSIHCQPYSKSFSDPPKLQKQTSNENKKLVKNGKTVSLKCPVEKSTDSEIFFEWSKNGITIEDFDKRIKLTDSGLLKIKNPVPEDSGRFVCKAINGFGSVEYSVYLRVIDEDFDYTVPDQDQPAVAQSHSYPTQLTKAYEFDSLSKEDTEVSTNHMMVKKTGSDVRFKCGVSSTPKTSIIWFHNDQQLSESEPRRGRNSLVINDLKPEDSGNYTCVASNQFGTVTQTYIIRVIHDVLSKPQMDDSVPKNVTVIRGEQAILHCSTKSEERPRIQWLKKMDIISEKEEAESNYEVSSDSSHYIKVMGELYKSLDTSKSQTQTIQLSETHYSNRLVIDLTTEWDSGKYLCMGTNKVGSSFRTTFLTVLSPVPKRMDPITRVELLPLPIAVALVSVLVIIMMALIVWLSLCCTRKAEPIIQTIPYREKSRPAGRPPIIRTLDQNCHKVPNMVKNPSPELLSNRPESPFYSELMSNSTRLSNVYQLYSNPNSSPNHLKPTQSQIHPNKSQPYFC